MSRPRKPARLTRRSDKGTTWYILYHDGERGRSYSTGTADRDEAEKVFAEWSRQRQLGFGKRATQLRAPDELRVADALTIYLTEIEGTPGAASAAYNAERLIEHFGGATVDMVTHETVKGYITARRQTRGRRGQPIKDATIHRELAVLRRSLNVAVQRGRLTRAPFVSAPKLAEPRDIWLERFEVDLLTKACTEEHLKLFIQVALHTLGRKAAVLDLRWLGQVDFDRKLIHLNPPGRVQTQKRRPPVPMSDNLYQLLVEAHRTSKSPYVISYNGEKLLDVKRSFRGTAKRAAYLAIQEGRRLDRGHPQRREWAKTAKRLWRTTPHTLRHTGATWLVQELGQSALPQIAAWLGHSIIRTTEKYIHHCPEHLRELAEALDNRSLTGRRKITLLTPIAGGKE